AIGSCVNMAARLMSKAQGGILIDAETFSHLPSTVLFALTPHEPIRVKGRVDTLLYYTYDFDGSLELKSSIVEDYEVRADCKKLFFDLLKELSEHVGTEAKAEGEWGPLSAAKRAIALWGGVGGSQSVSVHESGQPNYLRCVVVEGTVGTGKASVGRWLVQKTEESGKRVLQHKITARSTVVSYGIWAGIFWQFFPKDVFVSERSRSRLLRVLVKDVFEGYRDSKGKGHDELTITRLIQSGLGIDTDKMERGRVDSRAGSFMSVEPASTLDHAVVMGVLQHLFSYLLHMHVVLVYVSGVELADEDSLTLLLLLLRSSAPMRSAVVLSGTSSEDANSTRLDTVSRKAYSNPRDSLIEGWHGKARALCVALPQTQLLHLTFYSAVDITPILAVALGSHASDISPALATAVHTVT
ncbi:hypothetical protein B484DRAFT_473491, partial [Ochromonadaceae sp. CCMP2298]